MPTITLKFKENTIAEYPINKGGTLSVGRLNDNQIVVENLAVSGHHCKIDSVGEGYLLTDLQSKNGTFVNQQRVASHWLKNGDEVTVGKHTLVFVHEGAAAAPKPTMGDMEKTMVMDTAMHREMLAKSAAAKPAAAAVAGGGAPQADEGEGAAVLTYLAGGDGEVAVTRKLLKVGKADNNDIVVKGFLVGATAATIAKRPAGYYLSYVGGMSKPKVNGVPVKESVQLKDYDKIEVGSVTLQFNLSKA